MNFILITLAARTAFYLFLFLKSHRAANGRGMVQATATAYNLPVSAAFVLCLCISLLTINPLLDWKLKANAKEQACRFTGYKAYAVCTDLKERIGTPVVFGFDFGPGPNGVAEHIETATTRQVITPAADVAPTIQPVDLTTDPDLYPAEWLNGEDGLNFIAGLLGKLEKQPRPEGVAVKSVATFPG